MTPGREKSGTEAAVSDAPENANEEFGRGDQQFGGGAGDVEYGEEKVAVGEEGIVADVTAVPRPAITMDDEREGVTLPGSDPDDLVTLDEEAVMASHQAEEE